MPPNSLVTSAFFPGGRSPGRVLLTQSQENTPVLKISGYTKNASGTILPNCTVSLIRTRDNYPVDKTISDSNGFYSFMMIGPAETFYVVAYLAGAPDVSGTTVNTIAGTLS